MNNENTKINGSFVSEKISKIRFVQENYEESTKFVSGSANSIKLWKLIKNDFIICEEEETDLVPKNVAKIPVTGDITGLEFVDYNNFAACSSNGTVFLIYLNDSEIKENYQFSQLHKFSTGVVAPSTGLSVYDEDVATIGEDGSINILSVLTQKVAHTIPEADSCSLTAVSFVSHKELISGNRFGIMKSFDLKSGSNKPTATFTLSCRDSKKTNAVTAIAYHPTQKHIILGGSEEGSITVWDLRQPTYPASFLSAHDYSITEMQFHQTQPSKLFTASENGELWQWNQLQTIQTDLDKTPIDTMNPWLNGERAKNKINVTSILGDLRKSVNSFDTHRDRLVSCCDNEAIYLFDNLY